MPFVPSGIRETGTRHAGHSTLESESNWFQLHRSYPKHDGKIVSINCGVAQKQIRRESDKDILMADQDLRSRERRFTTSSIPQDKRYGHTSDATANAFDCWWCKTAVQRTAIVAQASTIMSEYTQIGPLGCARDGHAHCSLRDASGRIRRRQRAST